MNIVPNTDPNILEGTALEARPSETGCIAQMNS